MASGVAVRQARGTSLTLPDTAWINPPIHATQENKTVQETAV
jgi:hypothetical protein